MLDIRPIHLSEYELESGQSEQISIGEAPGRIHFLGEHGGPDSGLYLSAAIDRHIKVAVSGRKDNSLRFYAFDLKERKRSTLVNLKYKREDRWANYIKAAIQTFSEYGFPTKGLNFTVYGNIPQQIGLASSTAMEIAAAFALRGFFKVKIKEADFIEKLRKAHETLFGTAVEPADYLIGFTARKDQFMVIDKKTQKIKRIKSPFSRYRILLMDSRVPRMGVDNELAHRIADIQKGLELLSQKQDGVSFMEIVTSDLMESMGDFPEQIRRRSMHIVQEIRKVYDATDALERKDLAAFSRIIFHSHESLRDLYEVSCPEVDWLVKRAQESEGVAGARMTGQGFGGCTYTFVRADMLEEYRKKLEDYERIFGFHPVIYEMKLAAGGRLVPEGKVHADTAHK